LDDGGDLTKIMHEKFPDLMKNIKGFPKKRPQAFCACMKWRKGQTESTSDQRQ
jgi:S-adenosylhomocysteine hydrolase